MMHHVRYRAWTALIVLAVAALFVVTPAQARERVAGVLHVHSDLTTGDLPLEEVARIAEASGIGAIFLAENYLLRVEYGLPPFRALTRVTREEPSVLGAGGPTRFLERVAATRRLYPRLIIVPGVEVMPHYFWTGSPVSLSMTLHNVQKNLLVFGVADPAALSSLAATGNRHESRYGWQSLADLTPAVLVVPGVVLLGRKRRELRRLGRTVVVVWRRRWGIGLALIAVGLFGVVRGWPFTVDRYPPWQNAGLEPYQTLIDQVDRLGGVTMWSFPEAADVGQRKVGPVQVAWLTEPYADDLLRTFRYTCAASGAGRRGRSRSRGSTAWPEASAWGRCKRSFSSTSTRRRACWRRSSAGGCTRSAGRPRWRSCSRTSRSRPPRRRRRPARRSALPRARASRSGSPSRAATAGAIRSASRSSGTARRPRRGPGRRRSRPFTTRRSTELRSSSAWSRADGRRTSFSPVPCS